VADSLHRDKPFRYFRFKDPRANCSSGRALRILGQTAPELNLDSWIGGDGKEVDPIRLNDYRGKVVFNDFHIKAAPAISLIESLVVKGG